MIRPAVSSNPFDVPVSRSSHERALTHIRDLEMEVARLRDIINPGVAAEYEVGMAALEERLDAVTDILEEGITMSAVGTHYTSGTSIWLVPQLFLNRALNVLRHGNPDGQPDKER